MNAVLITLRLSRKVNAAKIRMVCEAISTFETPMIKFPGLNQPPHIAHLYELNIWTAHPNTLRGYVQDFNLEWPGLQITIVEKETQDEQQTQYRATV